MQYDYMRDISFPFIVLSVLTSESTESTESRGQGVLTPVQVMTSGVWMLSFHNCYHPVYPATEDRQI